MSLFSKYHVLNKSPPLSGAKRLLLQTLILLILCSSASAGDTRNLVGMRGLNTIPDARFDDKGTAVLHLSTADPYTHASLGFQMLDSLYISLRQSAETSNPLKEAGRLYPGLDFKLHLAQETQYTPAIALGAQSAFGHKRMAGEFLSLSKRYHNFDVTGGLGWGRFAGGATLSNPLKIISHFDKPRQNDGEIAQDPADWFTGERVGLYAGLSYDLPLKGLSLTADWNSDRYSAEKGTSDYDAPTPWSLGLQYQPHDTLSAGIGIMGTDKIMGRISLTPSLPKWPLRRAEKQPFPPVMPYRPPHGEVAKIPLDLAADGRNFQLLSAQDHRLHGILDLEPFENTPAQIGRASRYMMRRAPPDVGTFDITPTFAGLQGPNITLTRFDLEQAIVEQHGSAEEIWRGAEFTPKKAHLPYKKLNTTSRLWPKHIILEEHLSLSEEDHGTLSRTSLIIEEQRSLIGALAGGTAFRFNLAHNLDYLNQYRGTAIFPVRSDIDAFAQRRIGLERFYLSYLKTIKPDLHMNVTGGYLEEQYAGLGGEILYRPFGKNWAIGGEAWQVFKRDPHTTLNQGLTLDSLLTGHFQAWYKLPYSPDTTFNLRLGRYLAEDIGGTLALQHRFDNGASVEGFVTLTDQSDYDVFGGNTNLYNGIKLTLPIGSAKYIPENSRIDVIASPFGRDAGQNINKPVSLYDMTNAFSLQHMARHWQDVVE